jgi:hypothetical protein
MEALHPSEQLGDIDPPTAKKIAMSLIHAREKEPITSMDTVPLICSKCGTPIGELPHCSFPFETLLLDDTQCGKMTAAVSSAYLLLPAGTARLSALVCAAHRDIDIRNKCMRVAVYALLMPLR